MVPDTGAGGSYSQTMQRVSEETERRNGERGQDDERSGKMEGNDGGILETAEGKSAERVEKLNESAATEMVERQERAGLPVHGATYGWGDPCLER